MTQNTQSTIDIKSRLMTSTLQTPYIYYTNVDGLNEQAAHALTAANGYFEQNNPHKTLEYYQKAVNAQSHSSHLLSNLGSMQCALGLIQEGLATLKKAVAGEKPASAALYNLGTFLSSNNVHAEAEKYLKRALEQEPHAAAFANNLGIVYMYQQKFDRAQELFEKAIEADANFDYAYNNMGMLYYEKSDYAAAQQWLEKGYTLNAQNVTTMNNLGVVLFMLTPQEPTRSFELFKKAAELAPAFRMPLFNLGLIAVFTHKI